MDAKNALKCEIKLGNVKGKQKDYFIGEIMKEGKMVS